MKALSWVVGITAGVVLLFVGGYLWAGDLVAWLYLCTIGGLC